MGRHRTVVIAILSAAVLLGLGGGLAARGTASAQEPAMPQVVSDTMANIACAPSDGDWTNCTVTLYEDLGADDPLILSLAGQDISGLMCNDELPLNSTCMAMSDSAVFICPNGCDAG